MIRAAVFAVSALTSVLLTGCAGAGPRAFADYSATLDWNDYQSLRVETRNGAVTYQVDAARSDVLVAGRKSARGATLEQATAALDEFEVAAGPHADDPRVLHVRLDFPESLAEHRPAASIHVTVPRALAVVLDTGNGAITASDVAGDANLRTSNGRITLRHVSGAAECRTTNGHITAQDIAGGADLQSSNGRIEATDIAGPLVAVTSNGTIAAHARPAAGERISLSTSNGAVRATVPASLAGNLDLQTSNGRIHLEGQEVPMTARTISKTRMSAKLGEGGEGGLQATTSNGSITVVFE